MSQEENKMEPKWYVVHTYSGYENKVKTDLEKTIKNRELEDFFFNIVVPMEEQVEIKDGKRKTNLKKVFPGYVLIKMIVTEESWYIVRNTRGVTGIVGSGTDTIPLTDSEIRNMGFDEVPKKLWIKFKTKEQFLESNEMLMDMLKKSDGKDTVILYIEATREKKILPKNMTVLAEGDLLDKLCEKFGQENVKVTL